MHCLKSSTKINFESYINLLTIKLNYIEELKNTGYTIPNAITQDEPKLILS